MLPWGAEKGECPLIESDISRGAPCEHEQNFEEKEHGIDADRPCEHEVEAHEASKECCDAGKDTEDKCCTDENLADRDHVREEEYVRHDDVGHEVRIPSRNVRVCARSLCECARKESLEWSTRICADPCSAHDLSPSCNDPLISDVDADDKPDPR